MPAPQGAALFTAESVVFAKFLAVREGYDFIGELIDAQLRGDPLSDVLGKRHLLTMEKLEADLRGWVADRAQRERR